MAGIEARGRNEVASPTWPRGTRTQVGLCLALESWTTRHRYPSQLQVLGQPEENLTRVGEQRGGDRRGCGAGLHQKQNTEGFLKLRQGTWMRRNRRKKVRGGERSILRANSLSKA